MPTTPTNFAGGHVTTVQRSLTSGSQTTGIVLNAIVDPTDPTLTASWQITGPQILKFSRKVRGRIRAEWVYAATASVDASTKDITLGTTTRNIDWKDGASITSLGGGYKWPAGTKVELVWSHNAAEKTAFVDVANTFTDTQTITAPVLVTGSSSYISPPSMTTAQRVALSLGSTPALVYDTDLSQFYKFEGGAWAAVATGTFSNAANNTAGKVDIATEAEVAAGTGTDATSGALNVIPVSIVKPTSSGATSGTVPCLGTDSLIDITIGGTKKASWTAYAVICGGTTSTGALQSVASVGSAGQFLASNGASNLPTFQALTDTCRVVYLSPTASATLANPTSITNFDTHSLVIDASTLISGVAYEWECQLDYAWGAGDLGIMVRLGTTTIVRCDITPDSNTKNMIFRGTIFGTAAAGASVAVKGTGLLMDSGGTTSHSHAPNTVTGNVATNGALTLVFSAIFDTSNGTNAVTLDAVCIKKLSTTAF